MNIFSAAPHGSGRSFAKKGKGSPDHRVAAEKDEYRPNGSC
jgi:hypothetical protein